jgi:predicted AAA+ superfamily ATPase
MQDRLIAKWIIKTGKSVLLLGPRQVGKSTLCQSFAPVLSINLADEELFIAYSKDPSRLKREVHALKKAGFILIDEIQRVPSLLNSVQALLDPGPHSVEGRRFLLTGSSAAKLKQSGANLLPGRVVLEYMDPLLVSELGDKFDLDRALRFGMLPGVYLGEEDSEQVLSSYADLYLREEIRAGALAKDIGQYARFLDIAALFSGQWLNYSKISSEAEISKETIRRYVSVLEGTLMVFRVPSFHPGARTKRRVSQKDKLFLFDLGVRNALLGVHRQKITPDQRGHLFEHWLILQIIYMNRALRKDWHLSTYRTDGGAEVDLVIERDGDVIGLEIKASRNIGKSDLRGLKSLEEVMGRKQPFLKWIAYLGDTEQVFEDGTRVIPFQKLLQELE